MAGINDLMQLHKWIPSPDGQEWTVSTDDRLTGILAQLEDRLTKIDLQLAKIYTELKKGTEK